LTPSVKQRIATRLLKLFGWNVVYVPPPMPKAVVMFYPHTSNWDFVVGILTRSAVALPVHYAAKDSLFRRPHGWLFRWLGGIPVDRSKRTGFTAQMTAEFRRRQGFYLAIAPEGTRRAVDHLRSGFYRLALVAQVPLACAFIDYARREVGILGYVQLSGDEAVDLQRIASAYAGRRGKHPAQEGRIAFAQQSQRNLD